MSALGNLSDVEFEALIADLLRAHTGDAHRVFRRAADGGVDVRYKRRRRIEVTQCKHYFSSSFAQLLAEAKREKLKVDALQPAPTRYRFVTSRSLTVNQTAKIAAALAPWISDDEDLWDGNEVERQLVAHEHVMRQHVKLWLAGGGALGVLLRAATHQRSQALVSAVREVLPRYVQTDRFFDAQRLLADTGTCLIAGEPGIGKTTMAQMLLLDLANQGFEPLQISADIDEAWDVLDKRHPQAFYYDDFLARSAVGERLAKNEDQRLVELIRMAARRPKSVRLILTTREYILREATALYETFQRANLDARRFLLELPGYTRHERAMIFYNHIYQSKRLNRTQLRSLLHNRAYLGIVDHPHYNPRVIEYITGLSSAAELPATARDNYARFALDALDHPHQMWDYAFGHELSRHQQALLLLLATMPSETRLDDLRRAFDATYDAPRLAFTQALRTLEVTFIGLQRPGDTTLVAFVNPSVEDFLAAVLAREPAEVGRIVRGAIGREQIEALWNLGRRSSIDHRPSPPMRAALSEHQRDLAEAVVRLARLPSLRYWRQYRRSALPETLTEVAIEDWLCFALRVRRLGPAAREALDPWLDHELKNRELEWSEARGDGDGAVKLLTAMYEGGMRQLARRLIPTVKEWLTDTASSADEYDRLDDLRRIADNVFDHDEWQDVLSGFALLAEEVLQWGSNDESGLDRLEEVAGYLGVSLDEEDLENARVALQDPEPDHDPEERRAALPPDEVDPDADIEALFNRLADV